MEQRKKFEHLRYNLSENIVYHKNKYSYKPLTYLATFTKCSALAKDPNNFEDIKHCVETRKEKCVLEELMFRKFEKETPLPSDTIIPPIKEGIRIIVKEIFDFFEDFDEIPSYLFIKNFIFTNQGTINIKRTISEIIETEKGISLETKFLLACKYFLGEKLILDSFEKLPNNLQNYYIGKKNLKGIKGEYDWILYWINHIEEVKNLSKDPVKLESKFGAGSDFLKEKLSGGLKKRNGMEIQYFWENFSSKIRNSEKILEEILPKLLNAETLNFFIYFLFQIERNHGEFFNDFFTSRGLEILEKLHEHQRWKNIFIEVFEILHLHLDERKHKEIIHMLADFSTEIKPENLLYLKGISEVTAPSVKNYLADKIPSVYYSILKQLIKKEKFQYIEVIFQIIGQSNFHILLNDEGIKCFEILMERGYLDYIDRLLRDNFLNGDIIKLKTASDKLILPICNFLAETNNLENFKKLLEWMLTEDKIKEKINSFLYENKANFIRSLICNKKTKDLNFIDDFLLWCLGSKAAVTDYKKRIVVLEDYFMPSYSLMINYRDIKDLVLSRRFEYLNLLFKWCFLKDDKITEIKTKLLNDQELLDDILFKNNIREDLNFFLEFCSISSYEYTNFQRKVIVNTTYLVSLIENGKYFVAKELIDWCTDFLEEERQEVKERLFPLVITYFVCYCKSKEEFRDFKKWINVSWTTFIKSHFTAIGSNIFAANSNFFDFHIYFLKCFLLYYQKEKNAR